MQADFTLKDSQQPYQAKITLVAGSADAESRLVPVTAEIDTSHKFWLRPGSFATVQVKLTSPRQFPMIPQSAARPSDRGFVAFVVEGDAAHERVLQLGMHTADGWVEVHDGLKVGDLVVTRGVEALAEGTRVQVTQGGAPAGSAGAPAGSAGEASPAASGSAQPEGRRRKGAGAALATPPTESVTP